MSVLTAREREIVALVAHELTNDEMAGRLYLLSLTAKTHVNRAMTKAERAQPGAAGRHWLTRPALCGPARDARAFRRPDAKLYAGAHFGYTWRMTKRLVDIDDNVLAAARSALATTTIKDTVNRALVESAALALRRASVERFAADGLPDLRDPDVMRTAWR